MFQSLSVYEVFIVQEENPSLLSFSKGRSIPPPSFITIACISWREGEVPPRFSQDGGGDDVSSSRTIAANLIMELGCNCPEALFYKESILENGLSWTDVRYR